MDRYSGATCPFCGKPFFDGDDIVVCPDCGAPHHRGCWKQSGRCAFEATHDEGRPWQMPGAGSSPVPSPAARPATGNVCPRCGSKNPEECVYCETCGASLNSAEGPVPELASPYGDVPEDDVIDGVPVKDIAAFVGDNSGYFLPRFKMFSEGRRTDWNWSAFFFTYYYLFYRKMYAYGFIILFGTMVLSLPSFALYLVDYQAYLVEEGLLAETFFTLPDPQLAATFAGIASILIWCMRGFVMLCTNRVYFGHVMERIHRIREDGFEDAMEYSAVLASTGRTNRTLVAVIVAGLLIFYTLSSLAMVLMNLL